MVGAHDVIRVARGELGLGNATKYGLKAGEGWCSVFLYWCGRRAGISAKSIPRRPWCDDLRAYYIADRLYFPRKGYTPKVGDIVCFHWGQTDDPYAHVQHVGLVTGVDAHYVYTIEGNSGSDGRVCEWRYKRDAFSILGYCSPIYYSSKWSDEKPTIAHTQVSVCEEKPIVTRRKSDGTLIPSTPKSGMLTISIAGFVPTVLAGVRLTQGRFQASSLTFEVLPEQDFFEGDTVTASVGEIPIFHGFVFTKTRDEDGIIRVTAYDSLRYFKNRDTYIYEGKTASELFSAVCRDHGLSDCFAEETGVKLPYRVEEETSLFTVLSHALDATEKKSSVRYTLRDECGKVTLRRAKHSGVVLSAQNITGFSYTSSIDGTYNRVKTIAVEGNARKIHLVQESDAIRKYGLLQTVLKQDETDLDAARDLLRAKSGVRRHLKLDVLGDTRLIAGDLVTVRGVWGDVTLDHDFFLREVTHTWDGREHTATVVLEGGDFDA